MGRPGVGGILTLEDLQGTDAGPTLMGLASVCGAGLVEKSPVMLHHHSPMAHLKSQTPYRKSISRTAAPSNGLLATTKSEVPQLPR